MAGIASRLGFQLWPRNSYVLKALEPGYSDLDLSLLQKKTNSSPQRFFSLYRHLRRFLPLLGEVNFYTQESLALVGQKHNSFELKRDPRLLDLLGRRPKPEPFEAAVFLLRQLEKDLHNLKKRPEKRLKKWLSHYREIAAAFPELDLSGPFALDAKHLPESIAGAVIHLSQIQFYSNWNPVRLRDLYDRLFFYIQLLDGGINLSTTKNFWTLDKWFIAWSPHRVVDTEAFRIKFSDDQLKFLVSQMYWEICGVLTQLESEFSRAAAATYLKHLKASTEQLLIFNNGQQVHDLLTFFDISLAHVQPESTRILQKTESTASL